MSSSRIGRVLKGRVCIFLAFVVFIVGLFGLYKNCSDLKDELEKEAGICRQEKENISQQLHVVIDYKQRLEKSLQSEKAEHLNMKTDYNLKLNEEKQKCEKINNEAKLRFSTLQQHYNLLQTQHDDFKEDCSKIQREQLDNINQLQAKLTEIQQELKRTVKDKDNSIQHITAQLEAMEQENLKLKAKLNNLENKRQESVGHKEFSSTQFNKLVVDGDAHYVIPDKQANQESEAVLPLPSKGKLKDLPRASSPKTSSNGALNAAMPLYAPSATPKTVKSSTTKKSEPLLPLPYQSNLPSNVVPAPMLNLPENDRQNSEAKPEDDAKTKDELKSQFNLAGENENGANEEFDLPNGENKNRPKKQPPLQHNDDMNLIEADYDPHNNLLDDGDDDAADGANIAAQDEAIRN